MNYINTKESYGEYGTFDLLVARELTDFTDNDVQILRQYAFYSYNQIDGPIILPNLSSVSQYSLYCRNAERFIVGVNKNTVASSSTSTIFQSARSLIYVPDDLVSQYKSAYGWRDVKDRIYGISELGLYEWEDAEIEDTWEQIAERVNNGTAINYYKIGNYKIVDLGAEGQIRMQIAAKGVDELANGNGYAQLTWVALDLLNTPIRVSCPVSTVYRYEDRAFLNDVTPASGSSVVNGGGKYYDSYLLQDSQLEYPATGSVKFTITASISTRIGFELYLNSFASSSDYQNVQVSMKINNTEVALAQNNNRLYYREWGTLSPNESVEVIISLTQTAALTSASSRPYIRLEIWTPYDTNSPSFPSILKSTTDYFPYRVVDHYIAGTGSIFDTTLGTEFEFKTYLDTTIWNLLSNTIKNIIKNVNKYSTRAILENNQTEYTIVNNNVEQYKLFLPSMREYGFNYTGRESNGPIYSFMFVDDASRARQRPVNSGNYSYIWTRSSHYSGVEYFRAAYTDGSGSGGIVCTQKGYLNICFCT